MNATPPEHVKGDAKHTKVWYEALRVLFGNCSQRPSSKAFPLVYVESEARRKG